MFIEGVDELRPLWKNGVVNTCINCIRQSEQSDCGLCVFIEGVDELRPLWKNGVVNTCIK